jgi:hypothetical protein
VHRAVELAEALPLIIVVGAPAALLVSAHLVGCAFVAYLGLLVIGLGENRTPAEQEDAERLGLAMLALLALAVGMWICLPLRRWYLAAVVFGVESAIGIVLVLSWLDEFGPQ